MKGVGQKSTRATPSSPRQRWPARFPRALVLVLVEATLLILLTLGTTWLLARRDAQEEYLHQSKRARSLAALIAQASGPDLTFDSSPRLIRLLEYATDEAIITGAAVVSRGGIIVAHSNVSRIGSRTDETALASEPGVGHDGLAFADLFDGAEGKVVLHPVLGPQGPIGTVALQQPEARLALSRTGALRYLLPAGLLLLAFVAVNRISVRNALRPTSDAVMRLVTALKSSGADDRLSLPIEDPSECAIERAATQVQELTEKQEALIVENRVLDYERSRMSSTVDHIPDGVIVTDSRGRVKVFNRAASALLGITPDDTLGRTIEELPIGIASVGRDLESGGQSLFVPPKGESGRQTLLKRLHLTSKTGDAIGTLYVLRDITAQKSSEKAQMEFLSQISHELKAPLNTIVTYVDALADNQLMEEEERVTFCNTISGEAQRMAQLVSHLLQLSRIELGNLSARFGFVKPTQLITEMSNTLRAQTDAKGQTLTVDVAENLSPLFGDKDLLGVALTNLITNAIKYTPSGGRISLRAESDEGGIRVEVQDTGIGIPEDQIEAVFERFVRSDQAEVQQEAGSGLGLSLVQEIIRLHDGRVTVESSPGEGSLFRIWLPCRDVGERLNISAAA